MLDIESIPIAFYNYLKFLYSIKKATHVEPTQTRSDFLETTVKHQRSTSTTRQSEREITLFIQLEINEIRCSEQRGEIFFSEFYSPGSRSTSPPSFFPFATNFFSFLFSFLLLIVSRPFQIPSNGDTIETKYSRNVLEGMTLVERRAGHGGLHGLCSPRSGRLRNAMSGESALASFHKVLWCRAADAELLAGKEFRERTNERSCCNHANRFC